MAMATIRHLFLLSFLALILLVNARLNLHPTDHEALLAVYKDLGLSSGTNSLCNAAGVICERRISNNSYVLRVTRILFKTRHLIGALPPAIGKLSELSELSLRNNHLVDQIPTQVKDCRKLKLLDLHNNRLSGTVPVGLSSLVRLRVLDLSSNKFSGDLNFLKYLTNLEELSLADNMFTGKVPASLRSFRNLRFFNFSGYSFLEGPMLTIKQFESLSEELQNVNNKIVPKRYVFAESNTNSSTRNLTTLPNLQTPAPPPTEKPTRKHQSKTKKAVRWGLGFLAGIIAGIICGTVFSVLFMMMPMNKMERRKNNIDAKPAMTIFRQPIRVEELDFLKKDDGVASLQVIGKGGCGEVYKKELSEKTIAIKKIIHPPKDATDLIEEDTKLLDKKMSQIKSEIQTVGLIRHRNILPLLAHVSLQSCHYLVYEFMKNGSLQDILQQVKEGSRIFDWPARHKVAIGLADGIEYLHTSHIPPIVHRDLKPANVLLDDDMEARIADFGLAKLIPDAVIHFTIFDVAGTVGYIAPEYLQTIELTEKCDIYSFGVLLAVLVMGKLPSDEFFQLTSEMSLVRWMRNVMIYKDPREAIDPKLIGNGYEEEMLYVLKIAYFCTLDNPKERPNSKNITLMLARLKH